MVDLPAPDGPEMTMGVWEVAVGAMAEGKVDKKKGWFRGCAASGGRLQVCFNRRAGVVVDSCCKSTEAGGARGKNKGGMKNDWMDGWM